MLPMDFTYTINARCCSFAFRVFFSLKQGRSFNTGLTVYYKNSTKTISCVNPRPTDRDGFFYITKQLY